VNASPLTGVHSSSSVRSSPVPTAVRYFPTWARRSSRSRHLRAIWAAIRRSRPTADERAFPHLQPQQEKRCHQPEDAGGARNLLRSRQGLRRGGGQLPPGVLEARDRLRKVKRAQPAPDSVLVTGFGSSGEYRKLSGTRSRRPGDQRTYGGDGRARRPPVRVGIPLGDLSGAIFACKGITACALTIASARAAGCGSKSRCSTPCCICDLHRHHVA